MEIELPDAEKCPQCGHSLKIGMIVTNINSKYKEHVTFPYMEVGESMHIECYLDHVIDIILKKKLRENGKD